MTGRPLDPVDLDGAQGEGGGQMLRSALALSVLTGRALHMTNIRARRKNPGLAAQHLACVAAAARICGGHGSGAAIGAREIRFEPGPLRAGRHELAIGTAGSTALLLHAIALPLASLDEPSEV